RASRRSGQNTCKARGQHRCSKMEGVQGVVWPVMALLLAHSEIKGEKKHDADRGQEENERRQDEYRKAFHTDGLKPPGAESVAHGGFKRAGDVDESDANPRWLYCLRAGTAHEGSHRGRVISPRWLFLLQLSALQSENFSLSSKFA